MRVLVTGATGYIGSHTLLLLLEHGYEAIAVDNFSNSSPDSLNRIREATNKSFVFEKIDVCDQSSLSNLLNRYPCDGVIHFAGYKSVGESISNPLEYYENNLISTLTLLKIMKESPSILKSKIIFSSSANIYGNSDKQPILEDFPTGVGLTNPYGRTKYFCEEILRDSSVSWPELQAISLRYFNPIGAHPSGMIGEFPDQIPNNLAPYIAKVASGELSEISVFGNDYQTKDGSGVRDFIHVMDLAEGHIAALSYSELGFHAFNLGTGNGTSVFELIKAFEIASSQTLSFEVKARRPGDLAMSVADVTKAINQLGWKPKLSVQDACNSAWNWEQTRQIQKLKF